MKFDRHPDPVYGYIDPPYHAVIYGNNHLQVGFVPIPQDRKEESKERPAPYFPLS
jgi:hypothetical protein